MTRKTWRDKFTGLTHAEARREKKAAQAQAAKKAAYEDKFWEVLQDLRKEYAKDWATIRAQYKFSSPTYSDIGGLWWRARDKDADNALGLRQIAEDRAWKAVYGKEIIRTSGLVIRPL